MLKPLKNIIDNPEDLPRLSLHATEYLQAHLNGGFLMQSGVIQQLKTQGYSEAFLAGFLAGAQYGCQIIDDIEIARNELNDSLTDNP